jgi:hypothetical protein
MQQKNSNRRIISISKYSFIGTIAVAICADRPKSAEKNWIKDIGDLKRGIR